MIVIMFLLGILASVIIFIAILHVVKVGWNSLVCKEEEKQDEPRVEGVQVSEGSEVTGRLGHSKD